MSTCKGLQAGHKWSQVPQAFTPCAMAPPLVMADSKRVSRAPSLCPLPYTVPWSPKSPTSTHHLPTQRMRCLEVSWV